MAAYQVCYFTAVTLTGVAVAARFLAICSAPLMIALLAALFLGERLTSAARLSLGMAVAGTALLVIGPRGPGEVAGRSLLGALLALGAGLSYAVYAVGAKRLLARDGPAAAGRRHLLLAALPAHAGAPGGVVGAPALAEAWPLLLLPRRGANRARVHPLHRRAPRVPATTAGMVSLLEPLTATVLGVMVFGESLGPAGMAGPPSCSPPSSASRVRR